MRQLIPLLLGLTCLTLAAHDLRGQVPRHLAAPPSDILSGRLVLPDPATLARTSHHAVLDASWQARPGGWVSSIEVPVDRDGELSLAVVGAGSAGWAIALAEPGQVPRELAAWVSAGRGMLRVGAVADGDPRTALRLDLPAALAGAWRLDLSTSGPRPPASALVVVSSGGDLGLSSYVASHQRLSDRPVAVVAELTSAAATVELALVRIETGAGIGDVALVDDGRHADGAAGDGIFGAWIGPLPAGPVHARVLVQGRLPSGAPFARSVDHAYRVEDPAALLSGTLASAVLDADRLAIDVGLLTFGAPRRLHLSAEVWGLDRSGALVPVAWLSHIGQPAETFGETSLQLHLDGRWLARAGATTGLVLRRLRVQDPDSHVVYDGLASLPLPAGALPPVAFGPALPVTTAMLRGLPPGGAQAGTTPTAGGTGHTLVGEALRRLDDDPGSPALMLSHGYCSGGNVWPDAHFDEPKIEFLDPNQGRSNDEFAQLLLAAGDAAGATSYGLVAHSQGGMAGLHLLTYYFSGFDGATGPRLIQSVASPYLGTPLASLGFFACGTIDDMTTTGAPTWLSGIPTWARQEVFYWTTQNSGSVCNFFANLVLASPNDGTVERDRGQLAGANSMGHVVGWCHTTGMSNPASYTDAARNAEMNALAAR